MPIRREVSLRGDVPFFLFCEPASERRLFKLVSSIVMTVTRELGEWQTRRPGLVSKGLQDINAAEKKERT